MAAAPLSPGYYPAPDGRGEQWWNGVSWSESRRGLGSAVLSNTTPVHSNITPTGLPVIARPASSSLPLAAIILGGISFFVNFLGPVAIIVSIISLRRAPRSRGLAAAGLVLGIIASVFGAVQLAVFISVLNE